MWLLSKFNNNNNETTKIPNMREIIKFIKNRKSKKKKRLKIRINLILYKVLVYAALETNQLCKIAGWR